MRLLRLCLSSASLSFSCASGGLRGTNSYDGFDGASNETAFLASARWQASFLAPHGYTMATIDGGWYEEGDLDAFGRPRPNAALYPSSSGDRGFTAIAAELRRLGLSMGVWNIRGIPRKAVEAKLPIANSAFTADEAARFDTNCSWDSMNFGVLDNAAGRAWYRSLASQYREWGVSLVKMDCMVGDGNPGPLTNHEGLYTDDFTAFAASFAAEGVAVSTSPGASMNPANFSFIAEQRFAKIVRVTQDLWDRWYSAPNPQPNAYPTGVKSHLTYFETFAAVSGTNDVFADGDMLPLGIIDHQDVNGTGIYGPASQTHLTRDEQRLVMTLWCVARAPLILGSRLPLPDADPDTAWTLSLLTNPEVLAVQDGSTGNAPIPVVGTPPGGELRAWAARPDGAQAGQRAYVALFNAGEEAAAVAVKTADAGLAADARVCARDLWARAPLPGSTPAGGEFSALLPPHGAGMFLLEVC